MGLFTGFRSRFWQPPRAHGEIIEDRRVSFLELFYDLVYVVVIARIASILAIDVTWRSVAEFTVLFGMVWVGWVNGAIYHELHGREDGRTRVYVFIQMLILALLAVFSSEATTAGVSAFAITYAGFLVVLTWLWYTVRRQDDEMFRVDTGRYLSGMVTSVMLIAVSAFLPPTARLLVWGAFIAAWVVGASLLARTESFQLAAPVTPSMVERYGLLIIIVLGEVVVGAVEGLSHAPRDLRSISTGMIGLMVGFAYWWTYFDFVGDRLPVRDGRSLARWMYGHFPLILSIAGAGAAMVSLVEHAADLRAPIASAWLLAGSVALGLLSLVVTMSTLEAARDSEGIYRSIRLALLTAAGASLVAGWWRPGPWLLALTLVGVLIVLWLYAVNRKIHLEGTGQIAAGSP